MLRKIKIFSDFLEIDHFITTKQGGVSTGKYEGLNLALHTGDNYEKVLENRQILANNIGKNKSDFIYLNQVHGSDIFVAKSDDKGRGSIKVDDKLNYDGIITNEKEIVLIVLIADCVPIIIFDKVSKVIGVIHSGWKGTNSNILGKAIKKCEEQFGSSKKDILVGIGNCISKESYEVGKELALNFDKKFYIKKENNKYALDLQNIVYHQALELGIFENNIEKIDDCTLDNEEIFFSARRDGLESGRFGMGIYLK